MPPYAIWVTVDGATAAQLGQAGLGGAPMQDGQEFGDLSGLLHFEDRVRQPTPTRDSRLLTIFRVGKLTTDRFEELCLVRNVGVGGMIAHVYTPLIARQRLRIEARGG